MQFPSADDPQIQNTFRGRVTVIQLVLVQCANVKIKTKMDTQSGPKSILPIFVITSFHLRRCLEFFTG